MRRVVILRLFFLALSLGLLAILDRRPEITNAFAEPFTEFREAPGAEYQQGNRKDDENLGQTQFADHKASRAEGSHRNPEIRALG